MSENKLSSLIRGQSSWNGEPPLLRNCLAQVPSFPLDSTQCVLVLCVCPVCVLRFTPDAFKHVPLVRCGARDQPRSPGALDAVPGHEASHGRALLPGFLSDSGVITLLRWA
jgi:hypothetical protein